MWLLQFLPEWLLYILTAVGVIGIILQKFIPIQYKVVIFTVSLGILVFSIFMLGGIREKNAWEQKVVELQLKISQYEIESQKKNVEIVEKIIYKDRIIRQKGEEIVKYIDREIVKYDEKCVIPKQVIDILNEASEPIK